MLRKVAICALAGAILMASGCGSSDDSASRADDQAIRDLVTKLNQATKEKDASAFCLIMQPSGVDETFNDIDRCVKETKPILESAGEQQPLKVDTIEVDGDVATVSFTGGTGSEAKFVREDGQWYVPLNQSDVGAGAESEESAN